MFNRVVAYRQLADIVQIPGNVHAFYIVLVPSEFPRNGGRIFRDPMGVVFRIGVFCINRCGKGLERAVVDVPHLFIESPVFFELVRKVHEKGVVVQRDRDLVCDDIEKFKVFRCIRTDGQLAAQKQSANKLVPDPQGSQYLCSGNRQDGVVSDEAGLVFAERHQFFGIETVQVSRGKTLLCQSIQPVCRFVIKEDRTLVRQKCAGDDIKHRLNLFMKIVFRRYFLPKVCQGGYVIQRLF